MRRSAIRSRRKCRSESSRIGLIPISLFDENAGDDAIHARARGNSYLASLGICDRALGDDVASNVVRVSIILNDALYCGADGLASLWVTDID